jgi:hypothetical protein
LIAWCERASKTPLHGEVSGAYEPAQECIQVCDYAFEAALQIVETTSVTAQG